MGRRHFVIHRKSGSWGIVGCLVALILAPVAIASVCWLAYLAYVAVMMGGA